MKIGILGGTFNPIHIGHLILAEEVREKAGLERIIFVPTYLPPHKDNSDIAPASDRFKMLKIAIKANSYFCVSDIEIKRRGRSYTIDTLKELKSNILKMSYILSLVQICLNIWMNGRIYLRLLKMVKFIVATRPGYPLEKIPSYISTVSIRAVDVSAFEIRQAQKRISHFVI